jgi:photosystem II stability/assembly factor-like uncharacterized protein
MKSKLFFVFAYLVSFFASAQPVWHQVLETTPGWRFDDVYFLNENLGWAAGSQGGNVFKTTDGGLNWHLQASFPDNYIRNIEFLDENIGFIGTLETDFYKTTDGGAHWINVDLPIPIWSPDYPSKAVCGMDTVGTNMIVGCGSYFGPAYVIKSTDSGTTWQYIDMSDYVMSLVDILFVDENVGYVSGGNMTGGIILKTVNGGTTWTQLYSSGINGEWVWKMQRLFSNPNVMFASVESLDPMDGKLLKSIDGGASWISKSVPDPDIQAVGFVTENHGWMGGHHTGFLETFDAGTTWTNTGFGANLNRIQFFNENLAYCAGEGVYKFSDVLGTKTFRDPIEREKLEVKIVPNPVKNQLDFSVTFKRADHIILRLFDVDGKLLKELANEIIGGEGKKNYSFAFPYQAGTYYLNLHNDTGAQSEKIIKR